MKKILFGLFIAYWTATIAILVACVLFYQSYPKLCLTIGIIDIVQCVLIYVINRVGAAGEELERSQW